MRRPWFTLLFTVFISSIALGQPGNDNCDNPIAIPFGPTGGCTPAAGVTASLTGDNLNATTSTPIFQLADDFGNGPSIGNSSADVWYELTPTGNRLSISLESSLNAPVLILFQADDCAHQLPIDWTKGTGSQETITLESHVEPGQRYLLLVGGTTLADQGSFTLTATTYDECGTCALRRGRLTASPAPTNGVYPAGQRVEFCYQATYWDPGLSLEWLHGVEVKFGPGWNLSTLETVAPDACTAPSGNWAWYDSWQSCNTGETFGPGFAFDAEYGLLCPGAGRLDGDPGNNFGDGPCDASVSAGPLPLQFCWSVQVNDNFTTPGEANLNLEISLLGDGYSGSWMPFSCDEAPATNFFATAMPDASLLPAMDVLNAPCSNDCNGRATISGAAPGNWQYNLTDEAGNLYYSTQALSGTDTLSGLCAGTYLLEVSNAGGTIRQATQLQVEAGLSPEAQAGFVPGCMPGEPIQLVSGVNISGSTTSYQWSGPNGFSSTQPNPSVDDPGEYFLEVVVDDCPAPVVSIEARTGVPEISCEASPGSIVFSWAYEPGDTAYAVDVLSGQPGSWLSSTAFEVTNLAPGEEASIELVKRGTGICTVATAEATCRALSCPQPMVTPDTTICRGEEVRLWVNIPPNTSVAWSPAYGLSCTNCIAPLASPDSSMSYQATITYPDGCVVTREVDVNVNNLPESILPHQSMPYCLGRPWEICLPEGNEYIWISPVGFMATGNCINFPITTEALNGTHTILVRLPSGCQFTDYLYLYPKNCGDDPNIQVNLYPPARPQGGNGNNTRARAFPNPVRSLLQVETGFSGHKALQLFRMDGQRLFFLETEEASVEIPTGQYPPGAYWLDVSASNEHERLKIIIIR
ncbi:MAG: T9SS type A sorting domain-containing protein [Phaeodactylibacter sp.]|nr:T9SS type A sorting domain-containing protein [Phaeodactylibacter sp.]